MLIFSCWGLFFFSLLVNSYAFFAFEIFRLIQMSFLIVKYVYTFTYRIFLVLVSHLRVAHRLHFLLNSSLCLGLLHDLALLCIYISNFSTLRLILKRISIILINAFRKINIFIRIVANARSVFLGGFWARNLFAEDFSVLSFSALRQSVFRHIIFNYFFGVVLQCFQYISSNQTSWLEILTDALLFLRLLLALLRLDEKLQLLVFVFILKADILSSLNQTVGFVFPIDKRPNQLIIP